MTLAVKSKHHDRWIEKITSTFPAFSSVGDKGWKGVSGEVFPSSPVDGCLVEENFLRSHGCFTDEAL